MRFVGPKLSGAVLSVNSILNGVRELWTLAGPTWRLPILVDCHDGVNCRATPAEIPLLKKQRLAIDRLLEPLALERTGDGWHIIRSSLSRVAEPYAGANAEDIVVWGASIPSESEQVGSDFVQAYVRSPYAIIHNVGLAEMVWGSFCQYALHRLLNERLSVNLWFTELHALRMRHDWHARIPLTLTPSGSWRYLISGGVAAWDNERHLMRWTLEATPSKSFTESTRAVEMALRARQRSETDYVRDYFDDLKAQLPVASKILAQVRGQKKQPSVSVFRERNGSWSLHGKGFNKRTWPITPLDLRAQWSASFTRDSAVETEALRQEMSGLQPKNKSVRDTRRDMAKPSKPRRRAARMSVRHASKGHADGELLALYGVGGNLGMADGTQQLSNPAK